jgi:2-polyprenyl-3-methyl-5-hydroxy-6-metoxy-1,4-benzoquinol methylase
MSYHIREDYAPRLDNDQSDERGMDDRCQDEVYAMASRMAANNGHQSVLDVGCGGGFKLMKYFSHLRTRGLDLEPNFSFVCKKWPEREWALGDLSATVPGFDLLIASDIIEHLVDPDELVGFIKRCSPKEAIISTPNRDCLAEWSHAGPPRNSAHVREWSSAEFREYMDEHFEVMHHQFPSADQREYSTQYVTVRMKNAA